MIKIIRRIDWYRLELISEFKKKRILRLKSTKKFHRIHWNPTISRINNFHVKIQMRSKVAKWRGGEMWRGVKGEAGVSSVPETKKKLIFVKCQLLFIFKLRLSLPIFQSPRWSSVIRIDYFVRIEKSFWYSRREEKAL